MSLPVCSLAMPGNAIHGRIASTVLGPIPGTVSKSEAHRNDAPAARSCARRAQIAAARLGPIPGNRIKLAAQARFGSIRSATRSDPGPRRP